MLALLFAFAALLARCLQTRKIRMLRSSAAVSKRHALAEGESHQLGMDFVSDTPAVHVSFRDVGMVLKTSRKTVLSGITGHFPAGSLVALMGPSGGGKSESLPAHAYGIWHMHRRV